MQRGKLDSTLARCPRHPYPCGVAARFWSSACCLLALNTRLYLRRGKKGIAVHGKMKIGVKKLIELVSSCSI